MFTADLSWSGPNTETVGQRRERKARERSSATASIKTSSSSRSSVNADRDLWWTSGLKKAKGIKSNILRPSSHHSSKSQAPSLATPRKSSLKFTEDVRDPTLQPPWTISNTLSPTLPSGAPLDPPVQDVPELEGDSSSRRTNSTEARDSRECEPAIRFSMTELRSLAGEHRWHVRTPTQVHVIDESYPKEVLEDLPYVNGSKRNSVTFADQELTKVRLGQHSKHPGPAIAEGLPHFESASFHHPEENGSILEDVRHEERYLGTGSVESPPMSQWQSLSPCVVPKKMQLAPIPVVNKVAVAHSSTLELTRFQRFIRRMERAGPKIILERLREDWQESSGEEPDEQLILEKQLWLLTAFRMQTLDQTQHIPKPKCDTARVLELYGDLCKLHPFAPLYPSSI